MIFHIITTLSFIVFSVLELLLPSKSRIESRANRWTVNIGLCFLNFLFLGLIKQFQIFGLMSFAFYCKKNDIGIFHLLGIGPSSFFAQFFLVLIQITIFDLFIYFQHMLFHRIQALWRIHKIHHSDPDLDVTSAFRFHPLEIIVSYFLKMLFIFVLGIDSISVGVFEAVLVIFSQFGHSNIYLGKKVDKIVRIFIVTPQMHLIHHSINQSDSSSNFGFSLSIWDKIFKTYHVDFTKGDRIGQADLAPGDLRDLRHLLIFPFKREL